MEKNVETTIMGLHRVQGSGYIIGFFIGRMEKKMAATCRD